MVQAKRVAGCGVMLLTMTVMPVGAADQQLVCKGQVIHEASNPSDPAKPIDLNVTLGGKHKLSVKIGEGQMIAPRVTSNNKIQLKFATKDFVGEYFHYTGDLFLIYPAGQLARLNCTRV